MQMEIEAPTEQRPSVTQFDFNDNYPQDTSIQQQPLPWSPIQPDRCERITAQVLLEDGVTVQTVPNVLILVRRQGTNNNTHTNNNDDDSSSSNSSSSDDEDDDNNEHAMQTDTPSAYPHAFWMYRQIREAIYGSVWVARVLQRDSASRWRVTASRCAVKELNWQTMRRERHRLAEDPIKEVAAMHHLREALLLPGEDVAAGMARTHIIMPVATWSDERHLYSIMPFAAGGELFDMLDARQDRCSEPEARYWMRQVCEGLAALHAAGVCHRDVSLENVLVTDNGTVVLIDLGMCLRHDRRYLIAPQGTCGKWNYMTPEIVKNGAFHGDTVDVWASGVILFLLLTGFPPWHRASPTDEHYRYMSAGAYHGTNLDFSLVSHCQCCITISTGYLTQMLTEWQLGLSADAMDLLQRMLFADPTDRLSLAQVQAHPWMIHPLVQAPQM